MWITQFISICVTIIISSLICCFVQYNNASKCNSMAAYWSFNIHHKTSMTSCLLRLPSFCVHASLCAFIRTSFSIRCFAFVSSAFVLSVHAHIQTHYLSNSNITDKMSHILCWTRAQPHMLWDAFIRCTNTNIGHSKRAHSMDQMFYWE